MKFFGTRRRPPADGNVRVETPVGKQCGHCDELIVDGDDGWVVPHSSKACEVNELAFHHACWMRSIVGSVAHQQGRCSCWGGSGEDDPGLTRRQNADRALTYFECINRIDT